MFHIPHENQWSFFANLCWVVACSIYVYDALYYMYSDDWSAKYFTESLLFLLGCLIYMVALVEVQSSSSSKDVSSQARVYHRWELLVQWIRPNNRCNFVATLLWTIASGILVYGSTADLGACTTAMLFFLGCLIYLCTLMKFHPSEDTDGDDTEDSDDEEKEGFRAQQKQLLPPGNRWTFVATLCWTIASGIMVYSASWPQLVSHYFIAAGLFLLGCLIYLVTLLNLSTSAASSLLDVTSHFTNRRRLQLHDHEQQYAPQPDCQLSHDQLQQYFELLLQNDAKDGCDDNSSSMLGLGDFLVKLLLAKEQQPQVKWTRERLHQIVIAQRQKIPFTTYWYPAYSVPFARTPLPPSSLEPIAVSCADIYQKLVTERRGGICFELNRLLGEVFRGCKLGRVQIIRCQSNRYFFSDCTKRQSEVRWDVVNHFALIVTLADDNTKYYVDAGAGIAGVPTIREGTTVSDPMGGCYKFDSDSRIIFKKKRQRRKSSGSDGRKDDESSLWLPLFKWDEYDEFDDFDHEALVHHAMCIQKPFPCSTGIDCILERPDGFASCSSNNVIKVYNWNLQCQQKETLTTESMLQNFFSINTGSNTKDDEDDLEAQINTVFSASLSIAKGTFCEREQEEAILWTV